MALPSTTELKDPLKTGTGYSAGFLIGSALALQSVASLCYPIAKFGLEIIEPFTFAFYRYLISSAVLLAIVKIKKHKIPIERKDYKKVIFLGFLIIPFNQTLFLVGQSMTAAGHGAFLFSTTPVFIFILALIHLKEKLVWRRAIGIAMAVVGVMVIMLSGALEVSTEYLLGDLIIVVSVTAWAYYTIIGKNLVRKYGALRMTAYALASGSAMYFPLGMYRAYVFDYSGVTFAAWGSVLYMALGLSVFVYVLWYWLLKYMEASHIAVYHNIQPVIATVVAYLFLGETLTVPFLIGGLIVLAGVITSET
ncbi:MAG: DMT family transporter [Candidatus Zixiibacteriota bacterium]